MLTCIDNVDIPPVGIPSPDHVRKRLAAVLTEAAVLRSQLRVSARVERERARLQRLATPAIEEGGEARA